MVQRRRDEIKNAPVRLNRSDIAASVDLEAFRRGLTRASAESDEEEGKKMPGIPKLDEIQSR